MFSILVIFGFIEYTTVNDRQIFLPPADKKEEQETKKKIVEIQAPKILPPSTDDFRNDFKGEIRGTSSTILLDVPFTSQAPFGEWDDPRQQDGCEEASVLMAIAWAREEELNKENAKKEILAIAEYEKNKYGSFVDTDVHDTVDRIILGYFGYEKSKAIENITLDNIKAELYKGNLVLVPCNGRKLGNPNYTPPGPERHMLVIRGYDPIKKEFITNDAGTRKGEGYRYQDDVLYKAIVNYPTGEHIPIKEEKKAMIVVWR